jgi:predicted CXXCH cytochrome family protein
MASAVMAADGDAIVTCISCHRAHGSQYDDLLRWDYTQCIANENVAADDTITPDCGCFYCHRDKDEL